MPNSIDVPQPIPYQGSKRQIAPIILQYLPKQFLRLVEPFAGSAAISIAVASRGLARQYWINDAHGPLIELWREIIERPEELSTAYARLWNNQLGRERDYFDKIRERFNRLHKPADFLYLLARCVKAAIRYNGNGQFNNTPDNRRRGARPAEMRRRIRHASELLRARTQLTACDYIKVLDKCSDGDVVYMDPPYQGVCGRRDKRYLPKVSHQQFCAELEKLNDRRIPFVVSYDGRTGAKVYGEKLPDALRLIHIEVCAGRSTQATLLGRDDVTYESLYLSPTIADAAIVGMRSKEFQASLW
jgi:DNA adenine methylase